MGSGSLGEGEDDDGFDEFILDISDLLTDNNIEMPTSHEHIQSYLSSEESVELPPFPGSDIRQEANHYNEYDQLENNLNSVQPVETSSLNPSVLLHAADHEAAAAHAENVLPHDHNMSSVHQYLSRSSTQETESSIQGCAPVYVDDQPLQSIRNNHFGGPSQNKVGVMNGDSSSLIINQLRDFAWVPQNQNCLYHPSPQSGSHPWCSDSNSQQPQPHPSFQSQELNQATVTPTAVAPSAPFQMRLTFGPQMPTTRCVFYPHSHVNTNPNYDQPSLVSRPQEAQFLRLENEDPAGCNELGAQQIQIVVSMPQEVHLQVLPNESAGPGFSSSLNERPSNQIQIIVSGLQPQGLIPTPTAAPIVHINPIQGIYDQQNQFMPTDQQGLNNIKVSVPQLLEESSRAQNQLRRLAQPTHPMLQMELGESSTQYPRKRVARRDHQRLPSGLNHPQQVSAIFKPQGTETRDNKRRALNHLYDPLYEGTGLPIDPHLRRFVTPKKEENDMGSTMSHKEH